MKMISAATLIALLLATPVAAQQMDAADINSGRVMQGEAERTADVPASQGHVVTSTTGCLEKLDPSDAADIRINYAYPYQECLKRLAGQKAERQKAAAEKAAAENIVETPRNYVRVKKPAGTAAESADAEAEAPVTDEIPESGSWTSKKYAKEKVNK